MTVCNFDEHDLCFSCKLGEQTSIFVFIINSYPYHHVLDGEDCALLCDDSGQIEMHFIGQSETIDGVEKLSQFTEEWLPLFRRNCYLSGCSIECTDHEQLEWTKWFEERVALDWKRRQYWNRWRSFCLRYRSSMNSKMNLSLVPASQSHGQLPIFSLTASGSPSLSAIGANIWYRSTLPRLKELEVRDTFQDPGKVA